MIAALDIGGTHVSAARVDLDSAAVTARCRLPLAADGSRAELLEAITHAATAVGGIERVGVAVPGPFDYEEGVSRMRHKLAALDGVSLRDELATAVGLDGAAVRFVNDADAFGLGEWWAGAALGHERVVAITLGTGLGSAFLEGGRIVRDGSLHLVPFRGGPVEDVVSRRGLLARYGGNGDLDVEAIAERARSGEARACETFAAVFAALAEFLTPWLADFDATCLVVGGSIARAWDLIDPVLRPALRSVESLEVVTAAASIDDAPLLGAARHAAS